MFPETLTSQHQSTAGPASDPNKMSSCNSWSEHGRTRMSVMSKTCFRQQILSGGRHLWLDLYFLSPSQAPKKVKFPVPLFLQSFQKNTALLSEQICGWKCLLSSTLQAWHGSVLVHLLLDELIFVQSQLSSYVSHSNDSSKEDTRQPGADVQEVWRRVLE